MAHHAAVSGIALLHIIVLAIVQGAAELLPVSSSAHVVIAAKLMKLDPTTPEMTLLLVMLHTGTMLGVIVYFWNTWRRAYFSSRQAFWRSLKLVALATGLTGAVGLALKFVIERFALRGAPQAEIELIFGNLALLAASLAAVGVLILYAGLRRQSDAPGRELGQGVAAWMGMIQGVCLPFRGFSRSGATISVGLLMRESRARVEAFSFALAVVLTPPVVAREVWRLLRWHHGGALDFGTMLRLFGPGLVGLLCSFGAGLLALRWLSRWLEGGRWYLFGGYCLFAAGVVLMLYLRGY